ncbi:AEC family transporter [Sulfurospirillum sp. T05]|uniref:AEC family transporter n=1 Tax=Sulfurospirillum tamanense TaxID=2813362 RepID=A0ABS2WPW3_9BACT|nr:AEC family transporter [Sulfurospirillum tamanensis]MBN2963670.1 AEC family transporter [Sulfurospirillum tamanensis]
MFYSILAIYCFVLVGFFAKKWFQEQVQERSFVVLSVYFFQPILAFWGLSTRPLNSELLLVPLYFFAGIGICFAVSFAVATLFFKDTQERSILTAGAIIGNTGNLGIPLGIAIFGEASVVYTSLMTLCNVFLLQSVGVLLYSRGSYSLRASLSNMIKLPVIWVGLIALGLNLSGVRIEENIFRALEMGAHTALTFQLLTFGMFLNQVKLRSLNIKLLAHTTFLKFLVLPTLLFPFLLWLELSPLLTGALILQLTVPMAVNNINFASLYYCRPVDVTSMVLTTSVLYIGYLGGMVWAFKVFGILD